MKQFLFLVQTFDVEFLNKCLFPPQKLLTNGDSSSREFVDPPGEFEIM